MGFSVESTIYRSTLNLLPGKNIAFLHFFRLNQSIENMCHGQKLDDTH